MEDIKWSAFPSGGTLTTAATMVGLQSGANEKFSLTSIPTASAVSAWDANVNMNASNYLVLNATTATAAATTTLTVASHNLQVFTGTLTQIVVLPVTSTLVLGQPFTIYNQSTGAVTVNSSGGQVCYTMGGGSSMTFTCIAITGTTSSSWASSPIIIAERLPDSSNQNWFLGSASSISANEGTGGLQIAQSGKTPRLSLASYVAGTTNAPAYQMFKTVSTSIGTFSTLASGAKLGSISWFGDDGTQFSAGATIVTNVTGTVSNGVMPSAMLFSTANTSGSLTLAMTISNAQIVTLANPLAAGSGGTGVNNGSNTLTLAGTLATAGAFASTFTMTGATNVTFPTSGTLATTSSASGIVNSGTQNQLTWYAATGTTVSGLATAANGVLVTSAGSVPSISSTLPTAVQSNITQLGQLTPYTYLANPGSGSANGFLFPAISAGAFAMQAGTGSAADGGGLTMFGQNHPTKPGWVTAGLSSGAGASFFTVNSQGFLGAGTDVFTVNESGEVNANGAIFANGGALTSGKAAGGVTGNLMLYPTTTSTGSLQILSVNNGGNYANILANAATTAARTWTLPDVTGTITVLGNTTTGSGSIALATSPTFVTPVLGVASATSLSLSSPLPVASGGNGVSAIPSFSAYASAGTTLGANTFTQLAFDTKDWDTGTYYNATTSTYTPLIAGTYQVNAFTYITTSTATDIYAIVLYKNGSAFKQQSTQTAPTGSGRILLQLNALVQLNGSTDNLTIFAYNSNGALTYVTGVTSSTGFQAVWVGP